MLESNLVLVKGIDFDMTNKATQVKHRLPATLIIALCLSVSCLIMPRAGVSGMSALKSVRSDIHGIRLGMTSAVVHKRLEKIGRKERDERKRQEVWVLNNDPRYSHIIVGFDPDMKLRYVTALARKDAAARNVTYSEIGDVKRAAERQTLPNNYQYIWKIKPQRNEPEGIVVVRGTDREHLASFSIKKVAAGED